MSMTLHFIVGSLPQQTVGELGFLKRNHCIDTKLQKSSVAYYLLMHLGNVSPNFVPARVWGFRWNRYGCGLRAQPEGNYHTAWRTHSTLNNSAHYAVTTCFTHSCACLRFRSYLFQLASYDFQLRMFRRLEVIDRLFQLKLRCGEIVCLDVCHRDVEPCNRFQLFSFHA